MRRLREITPGFFVATAELYLTTTTVVTGADGNCLVIDPALTVPEVAVLAADLAGAALRPAAGFATHVHWDHLLWSRELGDVPRYASARTSALAGQEREALIRQAERTAPGHDLELLGRVAPLPPGTGTIPWPGPATQVIEHDGHAPGHAAVFFREAGVLVAGDMCSDTEIPILDMDEPDPVGAYRAALARFGALPGVRWLIPGHGHVTGGAGFRSRLAADLRYLDQLERGKPFADPRCDVDWLRRQHELQLEWARA